MVRLSVIAAGGGGRELACPLLRHLPPPHARQTNTRLLRRLQLGRAGECRGACGGEEGRPSLCARAAPEPPPPVKHMTARVMRCPWPLHLVGVGGV